MLSRVADNLYWLARYLERAENLARLVDVNGSLSAVTFCQNDSTWGLKGADCSVLPGPLPALRVNTTAGGFDVTSDPGKTVTFTAPSKPGSYGFHCNIHNFMKATLTVT